MPEEKSNKKTNPVTEERKGQFGIVWSVFQEQYDLVKLILNDVVVVKAEYLLVEDKVEYWAFSEKFREVPKGEQTPDYDPFVHVEPRDDDPTQSKNWVEWIERKE